MSAGAQASATCNVAMAIETTSGVAETSPDVYIIMGGDIKPVPEKPSSSRQVAGQPFPTLPWRGAETFSMPMPMLPCLEDASSPTVLRNGLGNLFLALFGADDCDQLGVTTAYEHTYTWEDLVKTFTLWLHFIERDQKIRMCGIDGLDLSIKNTGELGLDFTTEGADLWDTADYGSQSQMDLATAKQITGLGAKLEWGQPGAAARDSWEDLKLSLKRNLDYGAPGKAGQHPAGSGSPQIVTSTKSEARLTMTIRDTDGEEIERQRVGGNTAPNADRQTDLAALVKARLSIYGPAICAGINGEADYNNAGTTAVAFAGSYTGGAAIEVGEIEMSDSNIYETALGTNKDLSFKLLDADATYEVVTGAGALAVAVVAKAITVTLAAAGSTASAVLAKLLDTPAAIALITPTLANGSTGAGTISEAQAQITSSSFKDGFRYRYTTGAGWSSWTSWIKVTKSAQNLHAGLTATFDDDDITAAGDRFCYCSHYRYMLRFTLPNLVFEKATPDYAGGIRKLNVEAYHTSASTAARPTCDMWDSKAAAYS
jgi:hypothetical protein